MSTLCRIHRGRERGQIIVLFALALVVICAMVGLVLDGGSTFAQRRSEQNAADLASLAGANDYMLNNDPALATARALSVAATNGYTNGSGGVTVTVGIDTTAGAKVTVDINGPHRNNFAGVVGMPTWQVSATGSALSGFPDTALGAGPVIFSIDAFGSNGEPKSQYADSTNPYPFGEGNGDVPISPGDIAWTNYGTGNVDTNEVRQIITGALVINKTLQFGEYIGQHNQGNHTALYGTVDDNLDGTDIPVPVVDHNGDFMGWATFHVDHAVGASEKHIYGWFVSPFLSAKLTVGGCSSGNCPRYLGSYVLKLVN